jgi:hypothetical protein
MIVSDLAFHKSTVEQYHRQLPVLHDTLLAFRSCGMTRGQRPPGRSRRVVAAFVLQVEEERAAEGKFGLSADGLLHRE